MSERISTEDAKRLANEGGFIGEYTFRNMAVDLVNARECVAALQRVVDAARAVARKRQYPEARLAALSKLRAALAALDHPPR